MNNNFLGSAVNTLISSFNCFLGLTSVNLYSTTCPLALACCNGDNVGLNCCGAFYPINWF